MEMLSTGYTNVTPWDTPREYSEDQIRENIFKTIQDLDIPARKEDVKVTNTNHGIEISVNYTVPVDLMLYKTELNFSPSSEGRDIMK